MQLIFNLIVKRCYSIFIFIPGFFNLKLSAFINSIPTMLSDDIL